MKQDQQVLLNQPQHTSSNYQSLAIKSKHLSNQNHTLRQTLKDLQSQIQSLRKVNSQLAKTSPKSIQIIVDSLSKQNRSLENALFRQIKINEELSCDLLMKSQLIVENQNQFRDIINNYEGKIIDLRYNIQSKQVFVSNIQDKMLLEKDQLYCLPNKANMYSFNQMNELKLLLERYIVQNNQLQLLNIQKTEQLQQLHEKIKLCQNLLKKKQQWKTYQQHISNSSISDKTKPQQNKARIDIEQQLTRYDNKYKYIKWHNGRKNDLATQSYDLKMVISKLIRDNDRLLEEKSQLQRYIAKKSQQCKLVKQGCKKLLKQMQLVKVQNQFYRINFKQLAKVTTQRKIKFYTDLYDQFLPKIQKRQEKSQLINYWKNWQNSQDSKQTNRQDFELKRMLKKKNKKLKVKLGRSNSCSINFNHIEKQTKKMCLNEQKQSAIFSFIDYDNHEATSVMGCTFDDPKFSSPVKSTPDFFQDEFSIISRPSKKDINKNQIKKHKSPFKKQDKV